MIKFNRVISTVLIVFSLPIISSFADDKANDDKEQVYKFAQTEVLEDLLYPETAFFPGKKDLGEYYIQENSTGYMVHSWVESKNGFGAQSKQYFTCAVAIHQDSLQCVDLFFY